MKELRQKAHIIGACLLAGILGMALWSGFWMGLEVWRDWPEMQKDKQFVRAIRQMNERQAAQQQQGAKP